MLVINAMPNDEGFALATICLVSATLYVLCWQQHASLFPVSRKRVCKVKSVPPNYFVNSSIINDNLQENTDWLMIYLFT